MNIETLKWDSEFFGLAVGRLVLADTDVLVPEEFRRHVQAAGFDLVYVMVLQRMLPGATVAQAGLELMDIQLTMSQPFERERHVARPYEFRTTLSPRELDECYVIAEQTARVSRFHEEPLVGPSKTRALYRKWVDNSLDSADSKGVFLVKHEGRVVGIHLIRTDHESMVGHCSVIGVEAGSKRLNIGRRLWDQAFGYWATQTGIRTCMVPFSLQNSASLNFHLKMGFNSVQQVKYIYHFRGGSRR